jgi:DNA invertase Pin-like site-specific DNA recombinase
MAIIGYARVSTQDQDLSGQLEALKAAGAAPIFREKISGTRADRPQLAKLMASLRAGDVVLVTKLDRLGRSTRELLDLIERIGAVGASFKSLGDPLWDTTSSQGRLLSTLLAAIAEFERELIRERTGEGRKRAMAKGVRFGRKPKLTHHQRQEAIARRAAGETLVEIARSYNVDQSMISRLSAVEAR